MATALHAVVTVLPPGLPRKVAPLCRAFLQGIQAALGKDLLALYLYGAVAFPDSRGMLGDIDFHVIVRRPFTERDRQAVAALHCRMALDFTPLGRELDGYYLWIRDARRRIRPRNQANPGIMDWSWPLHRAHILAGSCLVLIGPDPATIYPPASWRELAGTLRGELRYVEDLLRRRKATAYCVLNLCRILYSLRTRDVVVSKSGAATWALRTLPDEFRPVIQAAVDVYRGRRAEASMVVLRRSALRLRRFVRAQVRPLPRRPR